MLTSNPDETELSTVGDVPDKVVIETVVPFVDTIKDALDECAAIRAVLELGSTVNDVAVELVQRTPLSDAATAKDQTEEPSSKIAWAGKLAVFTSANVPTALPSREALSTLAVVLACDPTTN